MINYGLLANQGRREDNARMGGQVAHISAAEADMLRRMGGVGTTNPMTGLPEYYSPGTTGYSTATSTAYGAYGPGGQQGGPGGQTSAQYLQSLGIEAAQAEAKGLTNWGDAVTPGGMKTITQLGKDAFVPSALDNAINNVANFVARNAPAGRVIKGLNWAYNTLFGEGQGEGLLGEGEGDGQTQTVAPPSISPTYAPVTGSIPPQAPLPQPYVAPPVPLPASPEPFTGTWWDNFYNFYGEDTGLV